MSILGLLRASHPEPAAAVTTVAVALAAGSGRSVGGSVAVGAAVLAGQLSVGWHNDWLDADRDRASQRADKPVALGLIGRRDVGLAAAVALVAVVPLSLLSGLPAGTAHIVAVGMAWAYNGRLKATLASFVPYAVAFPLLVAFVALGRRGHPLPPWWALVTAGLLGTGAHLANAAPDVADDLAAGIRGLPQRLGQRRSITGSVVLLLGATLVVVLGPGRPGPVALVALGAALVVVAASLATSRRAGSRMVFRGAMAVALIDAISLVVRGVGR